MGPDRFSNSENITSETRDDIRIAYICLCHTDADFVARTARALEYKNDGFFVHVDKKSDISPFIEKCGPLKNVFFVDEDKRIKNYWGGFNSIVATVNAIELAVSTGDFDRFVILQGQDYPLFSNREIHSFFTEHRTAEFCRAENISRSGDKNRYMNVCGLWFHDFDSKNLPMKVIARAFNLFNRLGIKYRKPYFKADGSNWDVYKGWAHMALTRECILHVLEVYRENAAYNSFIKYRFPPDEMYFHTIIYNSEYKSRLYDKIIINRSGAETLLNLTYFEYSDIVSAFREASDCDWLRKTGCLYARKINSSSEELIEAIDSCRLEEQ